MGKLLLEWTRLQEEQAKSSLAREREQRLRESMALIDHVMGHECVTHQADALRAVAGVRR